MMEENNTYTEEQYDLAAAADSRGSAAYGIAFVGFVAACAGLFFFAVRLLLLTMLKVNVSYQVTLAKDAGNDYLYPAWIAVIGLSILALILLIASTKLAGRRDENGEVLLRGFDKVYTEIQVIFAAVGVALSIPAAVLLWDWLCSSAWVNGFLKEIIGNVPRPELLIKTARESIGLPMLWDDLVPRHVMLALSILLVAAGSAIVLAVIHSIARKCKAHTISDSFLTAKLCVLLYKFLRAVAIYGWKAIVIVATAVWKALKTVVLGTGRCIRSAWNRVYDAFYKGGLTLAKTLLLMIAAVFVSAIIGVLIGHGWGPESVMAMSAVLCVIILIFVPRVFRKYVDLRTGIEHIRDGDFDYKIGTDGRGEFGRTATAVNEIAGANKLAIQKELKTERLKTDLISNVSHDLRTPLTSMISYVDLLKTEGLDSENAPEYLDILEEKTARLKHLTDDLFEAAKASSGDMPVNIEVIDMKSVLTQAIAELEEVLEDKNINLIVNNKAKSTYVKADGRLLWRVMENLLTNVGKHALPGSRAYADLRSENGRVVLELKNMSAEQLNIDADELMERFKRGDDSRNTEGSGLGLAIARDLTSMMGGTFEIVIDGDLFKAIVSFPEV